MQTQFCWAPATAPAQSGSVRRASRGGRSARLALSVLLGAWNHFGRKEWIAPAVERVPHDPAWKDGDVDVGAPHRHAVVSGLRHLLADDLDEALHGLLPI